ncbi:MAG: hypothetical protein V4685_08195 [Bacteroidota bacterium]
MTKLVALILLLLLLNACTKPVQKPIWQNPQSIISFPDVQLQFKSTTNNWSASLVSFIQPIQLSIEYTSDGFILINDNKNGVIEGPAQICLTSGDQYFYYRVNLINKEGSAVTHKDYRSPKTVNPDSSLHQQRIVHAINQYRNLVYPEKKLQYFFEEDMLLSPKAGNYRAISSESLSGYYVQPGSCVNVPVKALYNTAKEMLEVTAGPLKDKFDNQVADGTAVAFMYSHNQATYRMEAALLKGYATVFIPAKRGSTFSLKAKVNETTSATIQLSP